MRIQFGLDGQVVDADYSEPFTDPGTEAAHNRYTDAQKVAA